MNEFAYFKMRIATNADINRPISEFYLDACGLMLSAFNLPNFFNSLPTKHRYYKFLDF